MMKESKVSFATEPFCSYAILDEGVLLLGNILGVQKSKQTGDDRVRASPHMPDPSHLLTATKPDQVLGGTGFPAGSTAVPVYHCLLPHPQIIRPGEVKQL